MLCEVQITHLFVTWIACLIYLRTLFNDRRISTLFEVNKGKICAIIYWVDLSEFSYPSYLSNILYLPRYLFGVIGSWGVLCCTVSDLIWFLFPAQVGINTFTRFSIFRYKAKLWSRHEP
jgi:hypothetical protein